MAFEILKPEWGALRPIRGILFDMDGLVLDSEKLYCRFWAEAAQSYGYPMTFRQGMGMRALSSQMGQEKLESYFGPGIDYRQVRARRIELMDAYIAAHGIGLKPGIRELLDHLQKRGIRCAITSSSPKDRIQKYLSVHGLDARFDALCSGHEVKKGKPEPDIYLYGAQVLGLKPEECLALEDAPAGITSAFRAGCRPVIVPDLDEPAGETLEQCFARADSLLDVIGLLEQRNE